MAKQLSLWASGTGWRSYTDYIGGRIMYEGYSAGVIKSLLRSPQGARPPPTLCRVANWFR